MADDSEVDHVAIDTPREMMPEATPPGLSTDKALSDASAEASKKITELKPETASSTFAFLQWDKMVQAHKKLQEHKKNQGAELVAHEERQEGSQNPITDLIQLELTQHEYAAWKAYRDSQGPGKGVDEKAKSTGVPEKDVESAIRRACDESIKSLY